jgi:hypothetical protein
VSQNKISSTDNFQRRLDTAVSYAEVWQITKETGSMMLFLDDLPLQVGAYYPLGTNNIVLNRRLVDIVEVTLKSKLLVNSLVYNLLLHEYLHALGELSEIEVRRQVVVIATRCFGEEHNASIIARKSPWILLKDLPLETANASKRLMQIVPNFEKTGRYIV